MHQYYQEHKEETKQHNKKYYQEHAEQIKKRQKKYQQIHKEKIKKYYKKYSQTQKGMMTNRKKDKKSKAKRDRNLNWIQMFDNPFDKSEVIDWHHINDAYVVALPKDLHRQYLGKFHREKTMEIVKQIYLI